MPDNADFVRHGEPPGCGKWNCVLCNALPQSADHERVIERLRAAEEIIEMVRYSGSFEGDMLDLMHRKAEEWLPPNGSSGTQDG